MGDELKEKIQYVFIPQLVRESRVLSAKVHSNTFDARGLMVQRFTYQVVLLGGGLPTPVVEIFSDECVPLDKPTLQLVSFNKDFGVKKDD